MNEGKEGEFHPLKSLSLTDDLKALTYAAVTVSTGRGHVCITFVADAGLAVLG